MLLPILDTEQHNVVMIMHSYSGVPGSAAAIYIASLLIKGGDGGDIVAALGGQLLPHIAPDLLVSLPVMTLLHHCMVM
ncbi:hypothetical protein EYC84_010600 [Monilinia fructicola]|uniref:Uncharacterized protein n=1 Tax=Monilinia fructicola TaxID=38448 RepID=A0A5M9JAB9_MONFR|nr:hypothetical protein EYC84_010600 [Monilinia fructicola]